MRLSSAIRAALIALTVTGGFGTRRLRRRGQNPLQRDQSGLCHWRLCRQRHVAISRPALSLLDRRGELWLYLWRLGDRFRRHRQQHPMAV